MGACEGYLDETLCRFTPPLEQGSKLSVFNRHNPVLMRPLFVTEGEGGDVECFPKVDGVAEGDLVCRIVSLENSKQWGQWGLYLDHTARSRSEHARSPVLQPHCPLAPALCRSPHQRILVSRPLLQSSDHELCCGPHRLRWLHQR